MKTLSDKDQVFGFVGNVGTPTAAVAVPFALEHRALFFGAFTGSNILRNDPPDQLYVVADLSTMWLKAFVPEIDIPFIRIGQDIEVKVTALPGRSFAARITTDDLAAISRATSKAASRNPSRGTTRSTDP